MNLLQDFDKYGFLNFSINYYFNNQMNEISSYNLGLRDTQIGKFKLNTDFGYTSFPISSLPHFGSFNPSSHRGLKGGKITLRSKKVDFFIFGGQVYGGLRRGREKTEIYGARTIFRPHKKWLFGTGWMKVFNVPSPSDTEKTNDYHIISFDSSYKLKDGVYFLGDVRYIFNTNQNKKKGFSLKTGPYIRNRKLSFEILYNYISPDLPYLGSSLFHNRKGLTLIGQYRPISWVSLFGSVDTFNEHLERILDVPVNDYKTYQYGVNLSPLNFPYISFSFNRSKRETEENGLKGIQTTFDMLFLSLSKQYKRFFGSVYYNNGTFNHSIDISQNYSFNRFHVNLRRSYPAGNYIYYEGYLDKKTGQASLFKTENINMETGCNFKFSSSLRLNIQVGYTFNNDKNSGNKTRQYGLGCGLIFKFKPLKVLCSLRYHYSKISISPLNSLTKYSHQIFMSVKKDLRWGKKAPGMGLKGLFQKKGKIKGCVFVDLNQNGLKDPEEEGLTNIEILLDRRKVAQTNQNGYFNLTSIPPGLHTVAIYLRNVPAFYEAVIEESEVQLKGGETKQVNLTVVPLGLISGKLILDLNENNTKDKSDSVLSGIQINLLKKGELYRFAFTNSNWIFTLDNLRPGSYLLEVEDKNIKEKYVKTEKSTLEISIYPLEEKKGLILLLKKYKKPKIKKILEY